MVFFSIIFPTEDQMRKQRFYHADTIDVGQTIELDQTNSHQIIKVLRLKPDQELWLFNNTAYEFKVNIQKIIKTAVIVTVLEQSPNDKESPCNIHLVQAIAKGQKMDYIIQKAVELGVSCITPLRSERTIVNIAEEKIPQRLEHWEKIIINACCQCGRSIVPPIYPPIAFKEWLIKNQASVNIILDPTSDMSLTKLPVENSANLIIGPEGGFSEDELAWGKKHGCLKVFLGRRILRTETASIVAIAGLQLQYGDLT